MIKISTLDNGIRVMTDSSKSAESVKLGVWVKCGSRCETEQQNGISHVLEHMAFKGTKKRTAFEISSAIEDVGGFINAYTDLFTTAYHVHVLKNDIALGLDIIADILQNSTMNPKELAKEKGVITQEINMINDNPRNVIWDFFNQTAYPDQPIGRPIIGNEKNVLSFSSKQLLDYIHTQYTPDRMVISASGAVEHNQFLEECKKLFLGIKPGKAPAVLPAKYVGGDFRKIRPDEQINLLLGFKGIDLFDKDYYVAKLLSMILGGGMSSRLNQEIREKRGLVYSVYTYNCSKSDTGEFIIYAGTGEKEVKELMPVLCDEIVHFADKIDPSEIQRAKACLLSSQLMHRENILSHAEANAYDLLFRNRVRTAKEIIKAIKSVTAEQVQALAKQIFSGKPTFATIGPVKNVMTYEDICNRLKK